MNKQSSPASGKTAKPIPAWSVPIAVTDVPESGRHVDLVADAAAREAIAKAGGLAGLARLEASFDLTRQGDDGLRATGRVTASVVQTCVVTLEPIESEVDEPIELTFTADETAASADGAREPQSRAPKVVQALEADDPPETLHNGMADLGAVATEFLLLGIDPYPRKPGVVFDAPPAGDPSSHPFAALAALKKDGGSKGP
jgi:uncharacterized metal-binding protein YceD (DUF177 family)